MTSSQHTDLSVLNCFPLKWVFVIGLFTILILSATSNLCAKSSIQLGKRIYREGILPSGEPIRAKVAGDILVEGTQFSCATCHRRSGFGSSEETVYVPPVTGPLLYQDRQLRRVDMFRKLYQEVQPNRLRARVRDGRMRPAYTDQTLAISIREGKDSTNHELELLMPRYLLSDEDMGHLLAYLKSLSSAHAPGVTNSEIHFATVVTEGADPGKRVAMRDVIDAYFRWKNTDTQARLQRPGYSPWYKDDFHGTYREWVLHVWELKGPPKTWRDQLEKYYREQPVFALLSGIGAGTWQPVHDFCEWAEVPCLFPNTDLPVVLRTSAYSLYFFKGLTVEAEALARHLHNQSELVSTTRIVQVYRDVESSYVPARALQRVLQDYGITHVQDQLIEGTQALTSAFWENLLKNGQPSILVLWLEDDDLEALASVSGSIDGIQQIYFSYSRLKATLLSSLTNLRDKLYFTYPFALPGHEIPRMYRIRAWLRSRRVKRTHERIQFNTYFALSIADHSLVHLVENFSRDYFIESIEHETE
ncbi:MAG: hypothetical protein O7C75_01215, partial [Verrucomicrobia bacterium]|nr:hypothetical protein [Verrucomicrobiota bacterium]